MARIELVEALTAGQSIVGEAEQARGTQFAESRPTGARTQETAEELAAESSTAAAVAAGGTGAGANASEPIEPSGAAIPGEGAEEEAPEATPTPVDVPTEGDSDVSAQGSVEGSVDETDDGNAEAQGTS
jgi:large subunit ribosomal protein L17